LHGLLFEEIWTQPKWQFRPPRSLAETVLFVKLYMSIIEALFQVSDYPALFIGGGCQICEVPQPPNAVTRPATPVRTAGRGRQVPHAAMHM
jgi:hypothetical protein